MQLLQHCTIRAPIRRCFDLLRCSEAHELTSSIDERAVARKTSGLAGLNDTTWSARFFGWRFRLKTRVNNFDPPYMFSEIFERGLLLEFAHVYSLCALVYSLRALENGLVELEDVFMFRSPFGILREVFDGLVLKTIVARVMTARLDGLKRLAESDGWQAFVTEA